MKKWIIKNSFIFINQKQKLGIFKFSDKITVENLSDKIDFKEYYQMANNIKNSTDSEENIGNLYNQDKLNINLKSNDNSKPDINSEKLKQIQDKYMDVHGKFTMPFGWGWIFPVIKKTTAILVGIKMSLNIPWFGFFIISGITVRLLLAPFMIKQMVSIQKMAKVTPNIKLLFIVTRKSNLSFIKKYYYFTRSILMWMNEVKVNPFLFITYNIIQLPVFFLMIFSIKKISAEENLTNTGILWFKNLNEPDPYMVLPILAVGITYYNLGVSYNCYKLKLERNYKRK